MTLQVIGAGLGRTGTDSLKRALERLLGGPCYHMSEVLSHDQALTNWALLAHGEVVSWDRVFSGYVATTDWPAASYWAELSCRYPSALVLLSTRATAQQWWESASETVFRVMDRGGRRSLDMVGTMLRRFGGDITDAESSMAAYEAHNRRVRASVPRGRLLEWQPGDGWGPICRALELEEPTEAFPHANTTAEFRRAWGLR